MSISAQALFNRAVRVLGVPAEEPRVVEDFLFAVNQTSKDVFTWAHYTVASITALSTAIDADATDYENLYWYGIMHRMQMWGYTDKAREQDYYALYRDALKRAQVEYFEDTDNDVHGKLGDLSD